MTSKSLDHLIRDWRPGFSLARQFYTDAAVFAQEAEQLFPEHWYLVDHSSRVAETGEYFTVSLFGESIIVIRGRDGKLHAHYNVCRHRGSRICSKAEGKVNKLMCPYHAWTYDLDGTLRAARLMHEGFDKSEYALKPCHIREYKGLIFLNTSAGEAPDFDEMVAPLEPFLELHGLDKAKVAHRQLYPADANWKMVIENFFECYHCGPSHPELSAVHSLAKLLAFGAGPGSGPIEAERAFQDEMQTWEQNSRDLGHHTGMYNDEDPNRFRAAMRTPIRTGFLTETKDGQPAAPLMGNFQDYDGGHTAVSFNPFGTLLMSNDFAVLFRFTPISTTKTDMEIVWLVDENATEGRDYDVERITWVWDTTTQQDKHIIEQNVAGVMSDAYEPGPYSMQEQISNQLMEWYMRGLSPEIPEALDPGTVPT